jgi:hypothetical protein
MRNRLDDISRSQGSIEVTQNDQVIIVGQEVELTDLKNATHYAMDMIASQFEWEEPKSALDRLIAIPYKLLDPLKATSLPAATEVLVRVKSHHPEVDMVKAEEGSDTTKDLKALELEVRDAATVVMDSLDYEGDDSEQ